MNFCVMRAIHMYERLCVCVLGYCHLIGPLFRFIELRYRLRELRCRNDRQRIKGGPFPTC